MSAPMQAPTDRVSLTQDLWRIAETGEIGQLRELLAHGVDINASNAAGVTALMIAAYYGRREMVRALTDHGADVNLMDRDGYTAAMLAHHSGHEDIVRTLVARGAKNFPAPVSFGSLSRPLSQDEVFETLNDSEVASDADNSEVRTLHQPPNIWDMVHETHAEFNPRSAFMGHLPPINTLVLTVVALVMVGSALFGFIKFRGLSDSGRTTPSVQTEQSKDTGGPGPSTVQSSLAQERNSQSEPVKADSTSAQSDTTAPVGRFVADSPANLGSAVGDTAQPEKRAADKPRRPDPARANTASGASSLTSDNQGNQDKAQELTPTPPKLDIALPPENEKNADSTEVKKQETKKELDKAPGQSAVPAKPNPTPGLR